MFRILCLDGGGIKGVFTAAVLARIEALTNLTIADHFDLICGTSTGGILAIGLGLGLSAEELLDFYRKRGPFIFPGTSLIERSRGIFRQLFLGPKFSQKVLREQIAAILKDRKFGESRSRLVIPSYDAVSGHIYVFKTAHDRRFVNDVATPAVDVALATSAAPTYFEAASSHSYGRYVDGGVWANSPVMVGVTEAVSFVGVALSDIHILSVGTTQEPFSIAKRTRASALGWNVGLVNLMFEAQAEAAIAQAGLLVGGRLHRINYRAGPGEFSLDNASQRAIDALTHIGFDEAQKKVNTDVVFSKFVNGQPAPSFQPVA
jgi:patatin-like phospholipase/acyl hydrolase